jgi:hypothetical protein
VELYVLIFCQKALLQRFAALGQYRYTPPSSSALHGPLLTMAYDNVHCAVDKILDVEPRVNVVFDESGDRAGHRINNLSHVTRIGTFYYRTEDMCHGYARTC